MDNLDPVKAIEKTVTYEIPNLGSVSLPKWIYLNGNHVNRFTQMMAEVNDSHAKESKTNGYVMRRIYFYAGLRFVKDYGEWNVNNFDLDELLAAEHDLEEENAALLMALGAWFTGYFNSFFQ